MRDDIEAYSTATNKTYPNWRALIEAESNGYLVICLITSTRQKEKTWPWVVGPFATQEEAEKERRRLRTKFKREGSTFYPHQSYKWFVRPAWIPERGPWPGFPSKD